MIKAVIFDMDGVIINSTELDYQAWKQLFADYNLELSFDKYKSLLGMKGTEIIDKYIPSVDKKDLLAVQNKKENYLIESIQEKGIKAINNVIPFIKLIKEKYPLAIATSAPRNKLDAVLKCLDITKYFKVIITADLVNKGKPNPEIFLKAAKELNFLPEECVVFEDAPKGVAAAKNGSMACIAITTTHDKEDLENADLIINDFSESDKIDGFLLTQ